MRCLTTGELARRGGVKLPTIRYYERRGILPKPPRTAAGYRVFDADALRRLRFIKHAQTLGFTLREIEELLALRLDSQNQCADVRHRAEAKVRDVEEKIRHLHAIRKAINRLIDDCRSRGSASECPLVELLEAPESPQRQMKAGSKHGNKNYSQRG